MSGVESPILRARLDPVGHGFFIAGLLLTTGAGFDIESLGAGALLIARGRRRGTD